MAGWAGEREGLKSDKDIFIASFLSSSLQSIVFLKTKLMNMRHDPDTESTTDVP